MSGVAVFLADHIQILLVFLFACHMLNVTDETGLFDDDRVAGLLFQIHNSILKYCGRIGNVVRCQMRSLEEILSELNAAEKEYARKCEQYGIEEKSKKKKTDENVRNDEQ